MGDKSKTFKPKVLSEKDKEKYFLERNEKENVLDVKFGYPRLGESNNAEKRIGYLFNVKPTSTLDKETTRLQTAIDCYFVQQDGETFKVALVVHPYFFIGVKENTFRDVEDYLRRRFQDEIADIEKVEKIDLEQKNHLAGLKKTYMKLNFFTVQDLMKVRDSLKPGVWAHKEKEAQYTESFQEGNNNDSATSDVKNNIIDIREFDVTYYQRVLIDKGIRVGNWYKVTVAAGNVQIQLEVSMTGTRGPLKVFAFDIECTKKPLKFPDAETDEVMMISYMLDEQGYLIVNREHVGADVEDFEYTPKPEYNLPFFKVFNEKDEKATLQRFVDEIMRTLPHIFVTFNGDGFDWPFLERRAQLLKIPLNESISLSREKKSSKLEKSDTFTLHHAPHLDVFKWVARDSYLPQGSQGLKEVTRLKLQYQPVEVAPEEMVEKAINEPQTMAAYSVSDSVATYYIYMKYVDPFIFSLCSIIPMNPDDVQRKGTGTLCESLLMVEAQKGGIIFPNKKSSAVDEFYGEHLVESETYIGGHVESLMAGVFRSDLPQKFNMDINKCNQLIDEIDDILKFAIEVEGKSLVENVSNHDEVKQMIVNSLKEIIETPQREENPLIYHVDVAAMYPNIILTNRLQPSSIVDDATCASCVFNRPENKCKREMAWQWNVDYYPSNKGEYNYVKSCLEKEYFKVTDKFGNTTQELFYKLPPSEQTKKIRARLKEYCRKVYKKAHQLETVDRKDTVCMRENPFYVDTVRAFRDRRYVYKDGMNAAQKKLSALKSSGADQSEIEKTKRMVVFNEALQLAHKCILNSFYGYVVRKGSRWYSMQMAGIVTNTGSNIIRNTRETIELIGQPLELDTDGIWCSLPASWPDTCSLQMKDGSKPITFSFLCSLLNREIHLKFMNNQYQDLVHSETLSYSTRSECTLFFEVDGPYRCMVIPKSTVEEKQLKKRYVVFNKNGGIAELKGFEIKRRGELKMIKNFQKQVFQEYLAGRSIEECYIACGRVANTFLDIIDSKGISMEDEELLDLISESRNMSQELAEYKQTKSMTITTAQRLGQFLGMDMVKEKGLSCKWIVSKFPLGTSVTERALPTEIFSADHDTKRKYLRQWLKCGPQTSLELRDIVDWNYYFDRLQKTVQKMITLPAFLQGVQNPVPRVKHPEWILKRKRIIDDSFKQQNIATMFKASLDSGVKEVDKYQQDMEDIIVDTHGKQSKLSNTVNLRDYAKKGAVKKRNAPDTQTNSIILDAQSLGPMPSFQTNYPSWLEWQKKKWKVQHNQRKQRRLTLGNSAKKTKTGELQDFFQKKTVVIKNKPWQILQIQPTPSPGILKLWIVTHDGDMTSMTLNMKRRFYVNIFQEKPQAKGTIKVNHTLPHLRHKFHLYECERDEALFVANSREIAMLKVAPDVEGFYESQVPLVFRALAELGCMCEVKPSGRSHDISKPWDLSHLEPKETKNSYLEAFTPVFVYVYISHQNDQATLALFFSKTNEVEIIFSTPYTLQAPKTIKSSFDGKPVKTQRVVELSLALSAINNRILTYKSSLPGPTVVIVQSSIKDITKRVDSLSDFPLLSIKSNIKDSDYPAFAWPVYASQIFAQRIEGIENWYSSTISLSRYGNVPLCNFDEDFGVFLSDVLYFRSLKQQNHITWYSESGLPDLGGNEFEELPQEIINPQVCNSTVTQTFAIEIDVSSLAINAILQSAHIDNLDGTGLSEVHNISQAKLEHFKDKSGNFQLEAGTISGINIIDETVACHPAFLCLQGLVRQWTGHLETLSGTKHFEAVTLLWVSFYRWISSSHSRLYDHAMHRLIHRLITKVFHQLLSTIKELGANIVFANFNKITITTDKVNFDEAETYFKFLSKVCKFKKPLFKYLTLKATRYWEVLVFKDEFNFIGISAKKDPEEGEVEEINNENENENENDNENDSHNQPTASWNLAEFLPSAIRENFYIIVLIFIEQLHKTKPLNPFLVNQQKEVTTTQEKDKRGTSSYSMLAQMASHRDKHISKENKEIVSLLKSTLYEATNNVIHLAADSESMDIELNETELGRISTKKGKKNWALELVNFASHVLGLYKPLTMEFNTIKKGLLKLAGTVEFSSDSEFVDPSMSFILPDFICTYCNDCRDIDLLRDPSIINHDWKCPICEHSRNQRVVENRLIDVVRKRCILYQRGDLVCVKCHTINTSNIQAICSHCSSQFICKEPKEQFIKGLSIILAVAIFHQFEFLQDITENALKMS